MAAFFHVGGAGLATALLLVQALPQSHTAELRARFAHEPDPIHRAKLMPQLADAEFQDIQREFTGGELGEALENLKEYRSEIQKCQKDLDALVADPEKHPSGFKQLQIALRQSLRRLDEALVGLPADEAKPFLEVRKELEHINRHLIRELFPRQPAAEAEPQKPKS